MNELKEVKSGKKGGGSRKYKKKFFMENCTFKSIYSALLAHLFPFLNIKKCSNKNFSSSFSLQIEYFKHHWEPWWLYLYRVRVDIVLQENKSNVYDDDSLNTNTTFPFSMVRMNGRKTFLFLFFSIFFFNFNFLLHVSLSPHFMLSFVFRWTKVNF